MTPLPNLPLADRTDRRAEHAAIRLLRHRERGFPQLLESCTRNTAHTLPNYPSPQTILHFTFYVLTLRHRG